MGKFHIFCRIHLKFGFWLHKKRWHKSLKFQLELRSNKKVIAQKHLTNLYEMNSRSFVVAYLGFSQMPQGIFRWLWLMSVIVESQEECFTVDQLAFPVYRVQHYKHMALYWNIIPPYLNSMIQLNCLNPFSTKTVLMVGYWSPITDILIYT